MREVKIIPRIDRELVLIKKVPAIINDPQVRDHPRRLLDHIPPHPDLQVRLADQEEVHQEGQFQDHPELANCVNSNLIL